ncbi:MAG: hypothetical protein K2I23_06845 [Clostridia bacterium]|nr:hypothetical protein [Clostridia bacterium]
MAQYQSMRCYHHSNCEDRPAVSFCSKCGKGLCRQCTDNLRSEDTGKILCVDCLNDEMVADVNWAMRKKNEIRKEMIFIIVGFIIGLAAEIFFGVMSSRSDTWMILFVFSLVFFLPTLFASFRTIISKVGDIFDSLILRIIFFFILCVISPIMFIWRLVKRAKDIKRLKRFAVLQTMKYEANQKYANIAAKMSTRLTTEAFERTLLVKYRDLEKSNKEEWEKRVAEERAKFETEQKKNAEYEVALQEESAKNNQLKQQMAEIQAQVDETDKKAKRNARKAKREGRSTDYADSGNNAA